MNRAISRRMLLALHVPAAPAHGTHWIRVHRTAMACRFEVLLPGEHAHFVPAARLALDEADRIEALLTVFREDSAVARVNRTAADAPAPVDDELFGLIERCAELSDQTDGAFDITSTPLSRCWGFLLRSGRMPAEDEIAAARALVGMAGVRLDRARRRIEFATRGTELNFGAIGKGYALGRMAQLLATAGVEDALLSAGASSIVAMGTPADEDDDEGWAIDLRPSGVASGALARLRLRNASISTTGAGEQFVEIGGTRYGHVIDPRSGWPASGILSASVVAADPSIAEALSTAFFIGGFALAERYCALHRDTLAILTPDDGRERPQFIGSFGRATIARTETACT